MTKNKEAISTRIFQKAGFKDSEGGQRFASVWDAMTDSPEEAERMKHLSIKTWQNKRPL